MRLRSPHARVHGSFAVHFFVFLVADSMKLCYNKTDQSKGDNNMTETEQRKAARAFAERYKGVGYEMGNAQEFWRTLLSDVFGVDTHGYLEYEKKVKNVGRIDVYIPKTQVLIEHKSLGKNLDDAYKQAREYERELPHDEQPRWIITCDFAEFHIYNTNHRNDPPLVIMLSDLEREYHKLDFLVDTSNNASAVQREVEISQAAGGVVQKLYDALLKQYADQTSEKTLKSLNMLCVRLVFCLYAEDAGVFG